MPNFLLLLSYFSLGQEEFLRNVKGQIMEKSGGSFFKEIKGTHFFDKHQIDNLD